MKLTPKQTQTTDTPLTYISESRLRFAVSALTTLLAAILLFGAIINLYCVVDPRTKLALVATYTVLFAISIGLVTKARRSEVFAACAAYAAVLVVFISGNLGG